MAIRSASASRTFERHRWSSADGVVQAWVNDVVWKILAQAKTQAPPQLGGLPAETAEVCREVIKANHLEGMLLLVCGDNLKAALGDAFYAHCAQQRRKTDIFVQEVHWLLEPKVGAQTILIDDFAMRQPYRHFADDDFNPRVINELTLWTPTLSVREDVIALLEEGAFERDAGAEYLFLKHTDGISHRVRLCGTLWETSKNWSLDIEREIWDRALERSSSIPVKLEVTDLFLVACRRFAIDSLAGSAIMLLDMVMLLDRYAEDIEWDRLRRIKNAFAKPDWLWAALLALDQYERKTGRPLPLPDWAREILKAPDSFWADFVGSRLNWACPDARLVDFPRAHVKAAKGT